MTQIKSGDQVVALVELRPELYLPVAKMSKGKVIATRPDGKALVMWFGRGHVSVPQSGLGLV